MLNTKHIAIFLFFIACLCASTLLYFVPNKEYESVGHMPKIEIYTKSYCPYCAQAKELLKKKGVTFEEVSVEHDPELALKMVERSGGRKTVPQIFINDSHIGGCNDLYALETAGKLDPLLAK